MGRETSGDCTLETGEQVGKETGKMSQDMWWVDGKIWRGRSRGWRQGPRGREEQLTTVTGVRSGRYTQ